MKFIKNNFALLKLTKVCLIIIVIAMISQITNTTKIKKALFSNKNRSNINSISNANNSSIQLKFENGSTFVKLESSEPKRFIAAPLLNSIFTINLKIDKLSTKGKVWIGVVSTNNQGSISDNENVDEWYVSSADDTTLYPNFVSGGKLREGDIVTLFGNNTKVGFKVNNHDYLYSYTHNESKGLRLSVMLFNKGDKVSIINYTSNETEFKTDTNLLIPTEKNNLGSKVNSQVVTLQPVFV